MWSPLLKTYLRKLIVVQRNENNYHPCKVLVTLMITLATTKVNGDSWQELNQIVFLKYLKYLGPVYVQAPETEEEAISLCCDNKLWEVWRPECNCPCKCSLGKHVWVKGILLNKTHTMLMNK